jgi:hypothetical protein
MVHHPEVPRVVAKGNTNMSNEGRRPEIATAWIAAAYQMELAVGASHVASMLYPASRNACVEELSANFVARHGTLDLKRFLTALAEKLDARANNDGALAVRHYAAHGTVQEAPPTKAGAAASTRKKLRTTST